MVSQLHEESPRTSCAGKRDRRFAYNGHLGSNVAQVQHTEHRHTHYTVKEFKIFHTRPSLSGGSAFSEAACEAALLAYLFETNK